MGEIRDYGAVHLDIDLDRGTAQLGVRRGTGVGIGQPTEPWNIAGELDDALVVDVVQHDLWDLRLQLNWAFDPWSGATLGTETLGSEPLATEEPSLIYG